MNFTPVTLTNGSLTLEILPHGLTLHRLLVKSDKQNATHDVLIGPETPQDHLSQKYTNTIVGRYSNRLPVGKHSIERGEYKADFTAVANENEHVSLHGGPVGFDSLVWEKLVGKPELFRPDELKHLPSEQDTFGFFKLVSPDGDQGYPGNLLAEVLVALLPGNQKGKRGSVVIVYRAKLDKGVTPVNLTQHWGFNLEVTTDKSATVKGHSLFIDADHIVARDELSLSTGFTPTAENAAHTHNDKIIGDLFPESGYDDYYLFKKSKASTPSRLPLSSLNKSNFDLLQEIFAPQPAENKRVNLKSEKSGLSLDFWSNQLGVMFYTNNLTDATKGAKKLVHGGSGIKGDGYDKGTAAFLEFHNPLAAFLDEANKNEEDGLMTQDELYHNYVRLDIAA